MRKKASFRNPDEFYFAMNKTKTKQGVHEFLVYLYHHIINLQVAHEDASLSHGHIQLLKTQDMSYVNMKRALDIKVCM